MWRSKAGFRCALIPLWLALCCCSGPTRWRAVDAPKAGEVGELLTRGEVRSSDLDVEAVPDIPVRQRLRPCCAFGMDVGVRVGAIPVPGYRIGNVIGPEELGSHQYDSGLLVVAGGGEGGLIGSENNGIIYTCRGGFIDTAHVRDYADWMIFLASQLCQKLEEGLSIELPAEGGGRRLVVEPIGAPLIHRHGREELTIAIAQWAAFQLSIWHEIATWFGWSWSAAFPERASAFSPEDIYSNLVGIRIAGAIAFDRSARTDDLYNRSVDVWLRAVLTELGATSRQKGREAMGAVDGSWWDSRARLPDTALVLRRNLDVGPTLTPWLIPEELATEALRGECGESVQAVSLLVPRSFREIPIDQLATLEIALSDALKEQPPFDALGPRITPDDFPAILETAREQIRAQLGPEADRYSGGDRAKRRVNAQLR